MATKAIKTESTIFNPDKENGIFPRSSIAQLGVGLLEISGQVFASCNQTQFAHEITIQDDSAHVGGWGKLIFRGTLHDLINLIKETQS